MFGQRWIVVAYTVLSVGPLALTAFVALDAITAGAAALSAALSVLLWRGSRGAWGVLVVLDAGGAVIGAAGGDWYVLSTSLLRLAVLVSQPMRSHVGAGMARSPAQA